MTIPKGVVHMMMSLNSYVRSGQRIFRRLVWNPKLRITFKCVGYLLCGLIFSGASLANLPLPLPLSILCAVSGGWPSLLIGVGSGLGYYLFWGSAGAQGLVWTGAGLVIGLALGGRKLSKHFPLLMPALAAFSVAVTGLIFQYINRENIPILMYFLRIGLAFGAGAGAGFAFCELQSGFSGGSGTGCGSTLSGSGYGWIGIGFESGQRGANDGGAVPDLSGATDAPIARMAAPWSAGVDVFAGGGSVWRS